MVAGQGVAGSQAGDSAAGPSTERRSARVDHGDATGGTSQPGAKAWQAPKVKITPGLRGSTAGGVFVLELHKVRSVSWA